MSTPRVLLFLAIVGTLTAAWHYYLWTRLVRDVGLSARARALATRALVALGSLLMASFLVLRAPRAVSGPVAWVAFTWLGFSFFLVLALFAGDIIRLAAHVVARDALADPARRTVLHRALALAAGAVGVGLGVRGMASALGRVRVERVHVALRALGEAAVGYRIVQLSDIHVGPTIGAAFLDEIVARVNALGADAVVITGDLVDGSVADLGPIVARLGALRAKDGVFFVTGNHEYYSGADEWIALLRSLGIVVLRNERRLVAGGALTLAGVDDWSARGLAPGHGADLEAALAGHDGASPVVLLAHQPKQIHDAARLGVALQLSGHTHGGQLAPFGSVVRLQQPFVAGLGRLAATQIYVSRGTGYWGPPMRVGAPAEISELVLSRAG